MNLYCELAYTQKKYIINIYKKNRYNHSICTKTKYLRTSCAGFNNDITFSSRFNIDEISDIFQVLYFLEWKFLDFFKNEVVVAYIPLILREAFFKNQVVHFFDCLKK